MIESNIFYLKNQLEGLKGREYTISEIAGMANLNRRTVGNLLNRHVKRIDFATFSALLTFFRAEGLEIEAGDLIREVKS